MSAERQQIEATIAGLEAQRALLGDAIVDAAVGPLRAKLAALAASLVVAAPPAQTLKQATILFLDIVGSTTLGQHLDPEQTSDVMDGALAAFTAIVGAHGGKVLKYAGDSVLAVFGADEAHEDDPERAVRAGLALLEEGRAQATKVQQNHGYAGFGVRVGVHTGGVLLGGGVDAEGSIRGQAVNIAARMEQTAPSGGLRISHDTYRHVRGVFTVETQPPLTVKGVNQPIVTYLVQRAKPRAFRIPSRGIEGVETRMIGRDAELEQLQEAFHALFRDRRLAAVTVVAEAGLGKSRLLDEFRTWSETRPERFKIFQGRATPQTQSQLYGMLRDVLAWRLQIADTDSMATAREKIEAGVSSLFVDDEGPEMAQAHAHLLGQLVGVDFSESPHVRPITGDPRQLRNRGFQAAADMFRRLAARDGDPVIVYLDDLQWADDASLDFVRFLLQVNRDVPMLVVSLTRPTLFERRQDWASTQTNLRIELDPLDRRASRELALELLKRLPDVPESLRELIIGGADGNPFYMEELVKMLVDQGAIETGAERWTLHTDRLLAMQVPPTLVGVLQARLDGLPAAERVALQQASVIGVVFWDAALAALDAQALASLPALVRRELASPHADTMLDGMREFVFRHHILHQVTYDTVLRRDRRDLHARAAAWLAGLRGARAGDFLGATAEHYERAGDPANACEYYARAAEQAGSRYAHEAVLGNVARALVLIGTDGTNQAELRWRLLRSRVGALSIMGRWAEQRADVDALEALAEVLDDDRRRADAAIRRGEVAVRTDDYRTLESAARRGMMLAARAGDQVLRLRAQYQLVSALRLLGDTAAGKALAQDGLSAARAIGHLYSEAILLNQLSLFAQGEGDVVGDLEFGQKYLRIVQELGRQRDEAIGLTNLGHAWFRLGDDSQSRRYFEEGLRAHRAIRDRTMEGLAIVGLCGLALRQGDDALALAHAQAALDIAIDVQGHRVEVWALLYLGDAELALGRHAEAQAAFERSHAVAARIGNTVAYFAKAGLARVALARGDAARAMREIADLLPHLDRDGILLGKGNAQLIQFTCHKVLARAGDPRAAAMLASAHTTLQTVAATIADPNLRRGYLTNIPTHRDIAAAWVAQQSSADE